MREGFLNQIEFFQPCKEEDYASIIMMTSGVVVILHKYLGINWEISPSFSLRSSWLTASENAELHLDLWELS